MGVVAGCSELFLCGVWLVAVIVFLVGWLVAVSVFLCGVWLVAVMYF